MPYCLASHTTLSLSKIHAMTTSKKPTDTTNQDAPDTLDAGQQKAERLKEFEQWLDQHAKPSRLASLVNTDLPDKFVH